uniref:B30.2/SPRY domain-containing protein n=1 Tax=Denticeps clupeoides TaxID=299321 RepID=A0AAY4AJU6_9TELE
GFHHSNGTSVLITENLPVYELNIAEPTCRADLLKYWINLSLDDRTANKLLWITEGGARVCRMANEVCPYLDRPERYEFYPQVLCKECVWASRGYWEVDYTGWVVVGAAHEGAGRRGGDGPCGLGENEESWGLGWGGSCYQAWHNGASLDVQGVPRSSTIGVYLDQPAGVINFYAVESVEEEEESRGRKEVKLLHSFRKPINDKILPGFWVGMQSSCVIVKRAESAELSH